MVQSMQGESTTGTQKAEDHAAETPPNCRSGLKYKALFEGAGVAIWDCDFSAVYSALEEVRRTTPDVRRYVAEHPELVRQCIAKIQVRDVNEHAVSLYRAQSKDELRSRLSELFPAESERVFAEEFLALYEGKPHFQERKIARGLDGETLCVLATVTAVPAERPMENVIVTVVDVTAQERAREELRESEAKFRDMFELNAVPMILWDESGRILQVNEAFLRLSGYTREALEGRLCCEMLMTEADWPAVAQAKIRALEDGKFDPFEKDLVARDGTRIPVLLSGGSLAGRSDRGVTFLLDLREQKRGAEAAQKESIYARLLRDVALTANAAADPKDVMSYCLDMLCSELEFPIGHILLVEDQKIVSSGIWHCAEGDRRKFAEFIAASADMASEGPCVMVETVRAGAPVRLRPAEKKNCPRAQAATNSGIATLIILPLHAQGEPVAAMEFGSREELAQDEDFARVLAAFGTELSRVFERQKAQAALKKREELYRTLMGSFPSGYVLVFDKDLRCVVADGNQLRLSRESATGLKISEVIGGDFTPEFSDACQGALRGRAASFEMGTAEGRIHNVDVVPIGNDGKLGMVISHDITVLKSSEMAVRESEAQTRSYAERLLVMARRLVKAHEEERTRIARELHDDFNQRIAAACISISNLLNDPRLKRAEMRKELIGVKEVISGLSHDIRSMSHSLHPVVLEHMGAAAALRAQCEEFRRLHKLPVEFQCDCEECLTALDAEASICLYRVLQEAFTNIRKHSRAGRVFVILLADGRRVEMRVRDDGVLFDPIQARNKGLGLTNMEERVRLLGGAFSVSSEHGRGNEITATIPIDAGRVPLVQEAATGRDNVRPKCQHVQPDSRVVQPRRLKKVKGA